MSAGRYASASEVVRDSLRLLEEQEAMRQARLDVLRAEIGQGAGSGPGLPAERAFANARQLIAEIAGGAAES